MPSWERHGLAICRGGVKALPRVGGVVDTVLGLIERASDACGHAAHEALAHVLQSPGAEGPEGTEVEELEQAAREAFRAQTVETQQAIRILVRRVFMAQGDPVSWPQRVAELSREMNVRLTEHGPLRARLKQATRAGAGTGDMVGRRYQLGEPLGQAGGVFRAMDTESEREVALRLVEPEVVRDPAVRNWFRNYLEAAQRLGHVRAAAVRRFGVDSDHRCLFVVQDLMPGTSLKEVLRKGPLRPWRAAQIASHACEVLEAAHKNLLVHADLRPDNLVVAPGRRGRDDVRVLNFGVAWLWTHSPFVRATRPLRWLESLHYMAPERTQGAEADARSDVYSLGVVLYEMLTGKPPFVPEPGTPDPHTSLLQRLRGQAPAALPPRTPASLREVCLKALEKRPEDRYPSAKALREALDGAIAAAGPAGADPGSSARGTERRRADPPTDPNTHLPGPPQALPDLPRGVDPPTRGSAGRRIGVYRLLGRLGEGGMGVVYRALHEESQREVAIKSLHGGLLGDKGARERFLREAQALALLDHPNIVGLLDYFSDQDGCYIVMERAQGENLEVLIQRRGRLDPQLCVRWFVQACQALSYAHQHRVIHRDLKPSNLVVGSEGQIKLLDFGTAKLVDARQLTQAGMTLGTVTHMSKEQLMGKPLDPRSDVYSLGVTLYQCVTGRLPFYDSMPAKLARRIAQGNPPPPSQLVPELNPGLEAVILHAMALDPKARFQSASAMEGALLRLLQVPSGSGIRWGATT